MPYAQGAVDIRAQQLDFTALNQRLNAGSVYGARSFQIKRGDLTIGDEVRAREVNISVDAGSPRWPAASTPAASAWQHPPVGARRPAPGVQRRAGRARHHAARRQLRPDHRRAQPRHRRTSRPARARCAWTAARASTCAPAATTRARRQAARHAGTERAAPERRRGGDIDIEARGPLDIRGARSTPSTACGSTAAPPRHRNHCRRPHQIIDQDYLDRPHDDSRAFITQALANASLVDGKLAGLRPHADALHLRPGIEIRSATPDGDLVVQATDLSRYRYASLNPHTPLTGVYGSGEVGNLVIRAGGDLQIHGSINDGFAPPPT